MQIDLKILAALIIISGATYATFHNVTIYFSNQPINKLPADFTANTTIRQSSRLQKKFYPSSNQNFSTVIVKGSIPVLDTDSICDNPFLQGLGLNEAAIETIEPGAFRNLPKLKILILSDNHVTEIKEDVFNYLSVEELFLGNNSISVIHQRGFDNMPNLHAIYLTYNKISRWNRNWFFNSPKLKILEFNNNLLETLPVKAFKNFQKTRDLEIRLDFNKIAEISQKFFRGIHQINSLRLGSNKIRFWAQDALEGITLTYLDVSDNQLDYLAGDLGKYFVAFYTDIENNPWNCTFLRRVRRYAPKHVGEHWVLMDGALDKCEIPAIEFST